MAKHCQKLVFGQIRARLFLQFEVRLLQFGGERLRLFEQIFRLRARFDGVEHDSDALG